jgi:hypothetical protein
MAGREVGVRHLMRIPKAMRTRESADSAHIGNRGARRQWKMRRAAARIRSRAAQISM